MVQQPPIFMICLCFQLECIQTSASLISFFAFGSIWVSSNKVHFNAGTFWDSGLLYDVSNLILSLFPIYRNQIQFFRVYLRVQTSKGHSNTGFFFVILNINFIFCLTIHNKYYVVTLQKIDLGDYFHSPPLYC